MCGLGSGVVWCWVDDSPMVVGSSKIQKVNMRFLDEYKVKKLRVCVVQQVEL